VKEVSAVCRHADQETRLNRSATRAWRRFFTSRAMRSAGSAGMVLMVLLSLSVSRVPRLTTYPNASPMKVRGADRAPSTDDSGELAVTFA
jgi:hypothetical protein